MIYGLIHFPRNLDSFDMNLSTVVAKHTPPPPRYFNVNSTNIEWPTCLTVGGIMVIVEWQFTGQPLHPARRYLDNFDMDLCILSAKNVYLWNIGEISTKAAYVTSLSEKLLSKSCFFA